jgi:hypothetical protein
LPLFAAVNGIMRSSINHSWSILLAIFTQFIDGPLYASPVLNRQLKIQLLQSFVSTLHPGSNAVFLAQPKEGPTDGQVHVSRAGDRMNRTNSKDNLYVTQ